MYTTHQKGEIAQLHVQLRATEKGFTVCLPTVEARYDLILDDSGTLIRGQVKYADRWVGHGAIELDLRRDTRNVGRKRAYEKSEVDAVIIYVPREDLILWLPPKVFHKKKTINIRFSPAKNGTKTVFDAKDFIW